MEIYLLKSTALLALLLVFYKLFLEKEDMHVFKRYYLLISLIAAVGIPFISFTTFLEATYQPMEVIQSGTPVAQVSPPAACASPLVENLLWSIYGLGMVVYAIRFGKNLLEIRKRIRQCPKVSSEGVTYVLINRDKVVPHTFFHYIFLNKGQFESNAIPREVMVHERAHALQKHSFDIVLVELLQVVFWFHPLIYILKRIMKLNHEFLADKAVLSCGGSTRQYQRILLSFSSNDFNSRLVHPINYSFIKKRFTVMKTTSSKSGIQIRRLLVLPLLAVLLYGFSSNEVRYIAGELQEVATPEMVKEYNRLASFYHSQDEDHAVLRPKDFARMRYIYTLMSPEQKREAQKFPSEMLPPPPPPPMPPSPEVSNVPEPEQPPSPPTVPKPFDKTKPIKAGDYPPTPPPNPQEYMKELATEGARFFYHDKELDLDQVLELVNSENNLSIQVVDHGESNSPTVILSTE